LAVDRKTVARHLQILAQEARLKQAQFLANFSTDRLLNIQFDDLETSEHTKCKPLSVALAVEPKTRKILSYQVSQMPAKGHLAKISFKKYGPRPDERAKGWDALFLELKTISHPNVCLTSDENPHYPKHLKRHHPKATHIKVPGGRGAITGQGELKKKRFDPIFSLNHTCAMLRANMNRLVRRTWCTTKNQTGLLNHLALYVQYHNEVLTAPYTFKGAS